MSTPKTSASNGTMTTPPPNPVSAPRNPAMNEPSAIRTVKASMVICKGPEEAAPDAGNCRGSTELAEASPHYHARFRDPRCRLARAFSLFRNVCLGCKNPRRVEWRDHSEVKMSDWG